MEPISGLDGTALSVPSRPKRRTFDWVAESRKHELTPFQQTTVDVDWERSGLGPMKYWPVQLRHMVLMAFADSDPTIIFWGEESYAIYNEAATSIILDKHPKFQGGDPKTHLPEIWSNFEDLLRSQRETGEAVYREQGLYVLHRRGFLEEVYLNWKMQPIFGVDGSVVGAYNTVIDVTKEVEGNRRTAIIRSVGLKVASVKAVRDVWSRLLMAIETAEPDIPAALLYSVPEAPVRDGEGLASTPIPNRVNLEGTAGFATGMNHGFPDHFEICRGKFWLSASFATATKFLVPVDITIGQNSDHFAGVQWRGHGPPTTMIVCPIIPSGTKHILAFLVLALNPRRPYDAEYQRFVHLLVQEITLSSEAAVILRNEVEKRYIPGRQDELDRARLSQQLSESETKFARFATRAPIGLAILQPDGLALSANDLWKSFCGLEVGSQKLNWEEVLMPGEFESVTQAWTAMITQNTPFTMQTRVRRNSEAPAELKNSELAEERHLLLAMYPDLDEKGVATVMSCVTDISSLKWSEAQLRKRMEDAIEMKKKQERFIDMTSHEMRNPLSALIGCADEIIASLGEYRSREGEYAVDAQERKNLALVDEAIEAADTIIYCSMHQKRIIDDILTLSRLDSNFLEVSPEPSQPIDLVRQSLKMFESELKRADTTLEFVESPSLQALDVTWTLLDPSRVLQVLINLMTNAIKFTRSESIRKIVVTMDVSLTRPDTKSSRVKYVPTSLNVVDQTTKEVWGTGEVLYVAISVADTGRGLSQRESDKLFHVFRQASPKTHVQYGGSGLGLYISRQLVEMQGGEIGVISEEGKGSTFQFYIKTRRCPSAEATSQVFKPIIRDDALREACGLGMLATLQESDTHIAPTKMPRQPSMPSIGPQEGVFRILVVEDNLVNQKVLLKQLQKAGHIASVANHGKEALEFLKRTKQWAGEGEDERLDLTVVLMDLEMPVMDGMTCVKKIRELQEQRVLGHIPVIAVTANARNDQVSQCYQAGFDDVTIKPYRIQSMLEQIQRLVGKHEHG